MFYRLDQFAKFAALINKTYRAGQNCSCQYIPKKEDIESFIKGKHRFLSTGANTVLIKIRKSLAKTVNYYC